MHSENRPYSEGKAGAALNQPASGPTIQTMNNQMVETLSDAHEMINRILVRVRGNQVEEASAPGGAFDGLQPLTEQSINLRDNVSSLRGKIADLSTYV